MRNSRVLRGSARQEPSDLSANHQRRGLRVSARTLTLRDALLMVAELGGYTGKSSGGPPGAITLARGLFRLRDAADTLRAIRSQKCDEG